MNVLRNLAAECNICNDIKVSVANDYHCEHSLCKECNLSFLEKDIVQKLNGVTSLQKLSACCPICCALPLCLTANCKFCGSEFPITVIDIHVAKCSNVAITCKQCLCNVPAAFMRKHRCSDGNVVCMICELYIPTSVFQRHKETCDRKTFRCCECNRNVFCKNVFNHSCVNDEICVRCECCIPNTNKDIVGHYNWCDLVTFNCESCETTLSHITKIDHQCWSETNHRGESYIYVSEC